MCGSRLDLRTLRRVLSPAGRRGEALEGIEIVDGSFGRINVLLVRSRDRCGA
jgi:hypothetical protein